MSRPMMRPGGMVGGIGGVVGGIGGVGPPPELERLRTERLELLTLLALGPAFHLVLSGAVAASFAPGGARAADGPDHRPELEVALTGRLALAAEAWLGVDPDLVDVRLPGGAQGGSDQDGSDQDGWGELELTGAARAGGCTRRCRWPGWPRCGRPGWPWWASIWWWRSSRPPTPRPPCWPWPPRAGPRCGSPCGPPATTPHTGR